MTYSFIYCKPCGEHTAHEKPSAQSPHYCMRHEKAKLDAFHIADNILAIREMIKPFPAWERVSVGRD